MELFRLEHKKLWRKGSTRISVLLCFVYVVIFGNILSYQWFGFGSWKSEHIGAFSNNFDGYSVIRENQAYSKKYGALTEETLQQWVKDYQRLYAADKGNNLRYTDWSTVNTWIEVLYPELKEGDKYMLISNYVDPDKLTGVYERRQKAIEDFLEISGQSGAEREYLLQINEKVQTPFKYEWADGWAQLLGSMVAELGVVMALFLAITLSPLFAGEWRSNMGSLVLTTRNGWKEIAFAKILTGLAFTVELFVMLFIGSIVSQLFFMGTTGWDMPIQNIKLIAVAPMNMLQGEIYEYAFALLGAVGYAGIVMLISAAVKSNVLSLLLSLAVVYGPMMIDQYLPYSAQKALDLIPLVGSGTDIFRTNTFSVFGKFIWSPYLLITVPVLIGCLCIPFTVKRWARKMKV